MEVAQQVSMIRNRAMVGREIDVLVESEQAADARGTSASGFVVGRSYRDAPEVDGLVLLKGDAKPGELVRAKVTQSLAYDLVAEPLAVPV
jgi:ribosomal protein S12 methylthiotransferase